MGKTLAEKVWEDHVVRRNAGEPDLLYIDLHLIHEVTSPQAFDGLRLSGRKVRRPDLTLAVPDHNLPTTPRLDAQGRPVPIADPESAAQLEALERNAPAFGIRYIGATDKEQGIVHVVGPEQGFSLPGTTIVCGDSHTACHGGLGALAFGIGTSEVEHVLATQTLLLKQSKTMEVRVEGEVGRFRRNRLSPMPVVNSLDELNEKIRAWDTADNGRRINDRIRTVGQDFAVEAPLLLPVPSEGFDPGLSLEPRVDRSALITVRMAKYSVPARFIGRQVRVSLRASEVVVFDGRAVIARHQRVIARGGQSLDLDHYLEVLRTKPGALPGRALWPLPAGTEHLPRVMTHSGPRPEKLTVMPAEPANSSMSCSCTAPSIAMT